MSETEKAGQPRTGGCQCGAVRFRINGQLGRASICHCRMCQKAVGGPFISLADVRHEDFAWTRGKPATFRSSSIAERDFCAACGTAVAATTNAVRPKVAAGGPQVGEETVALPRPADGPAPAGGSTAMPEPGRTGHDGEEQP